MSLSPVYWDESSSRLVYLHTNSSGYGASVSQSTPIISDNNLLSKPEHYPPYDNQSLYTKLLELEKRHTDLIEGLKRVHSLEQLRNLIDLQ